MPLQYNYEHLIGWDFSHFFHISRQEMPHIFSFLAKYDKFATHTKERKVHTRIRWIF